MDQLTNGPTDRRTDKASRSCVSATNDLQMTLRYKFMIKWKDLQPLPSSIDLNLDNSHCLLEAKLLRVMHGGNDGRPC